MERGGGLRPRRRRRQEPESAIEGQMLELAHTRHGEQTLVGLARLRELGNETSCATGAVQKKKTSSVPYLEETTP